MSTSIYGESKAYGGVCGILLLGFRRRKQTQRLENLKEAHGKWRSSSSRHLVSSAGVAQPRSPSPPAAKKDDKKSARGEDPEVSPPSPYPKPWHRQPQALSSERGSP